MDEFNVEEFWKGLGRLYNASVELHSATEELRKTAEIHERRLDKLEVIQSWLAEKERKREKGE